MLLQNAPNGLLLSYHCQTTGCGKGQYGEVLGYGMNRFGKLLVYTSSGAGTKGVLMRVDTNSEIVLIHLRGFCMPH